jgi:hypothetical protein
MTEYFETSLKKGRGLAAKSLALIEAMYAAAEAAQPITGRGIGYKLFTAGLIPGMDRNTMQQVYRLLRLARERGDIPWEWIVDETRELERRAGWANPQAYAQAVSRSYRRDFWLQQPVRVEVWSEKGTVRGVLAPVLNEYGVGFRVMHGFSSATALYDVAQDCDGRELIALYCGDWDPSGLFMCQCDLPNRLAEYGELDAMDPNDLRARVEGEIKKQIEPTAWQRCAVVTKAEQESLRTFLDNWAAKRD